MLHDAAAAFGSCASLRTMTCAKRISCKVGGGGGGGGVGGREKCSAARHSTQQEHPEHPNTTYFRKQSAKQSKANLPLLRQWGCVSVRLHVAPCGSLRGISFFFDVHLFERFIEMDASGDGGIDLQARLNSSFCMSEGNVGRR